MYVYMYLSMYMLPPKRPTCYLIPPQKALFHAVFAVDAKHPPDRPRCRMTPLADKVLVQVLFFLLPLYTIYTSISVLVSIFGIRIVKKIITNTITITVTIPATISTSIPASPCLLHSVLPEIGLLRRAFDASWLHAADNTRYDSFQPEMSSPKFGQVASRRERA